MHRREFFKQGGCAALIVGMMGNSYANGSVVPSDPKLLPKLFLLGDSISILYTPYLAKDVSNDFRFGRKEGIAGRPTYLDFPTGNPDAEYMADANGGNSRMVLAYLRARFAEKDFRPDVVVLNCGLHDIKRDPTTNNVAVKTEEYRRNLETIQGLIRGEKVGLVWINTTPVDDAIHNSRMHDYHRFDVDVREYNAIAAGVFGRTHTPIVDLYSFTKRLGSEHYEDHVHYDEPTRALQAAYIAGFIIGSEQGLTHRLESGSLA
jgi:hypothetical protein